MHALRGMVVFCLVCFCLVFRLPHSARSDAATSMSAVPPPVTTHHTLQIGTATVRYTATFGETVLRDDKGAAQATMSSTAYVREGVADPARRPVLVAFNGGPGASSSPLHFHLLGPRRSVAGGYVDNSYSPLDVADIVLVDPVGAGLGRLLRPGAGSAYWNTDGDARAMTVFVRGWLDAHGRRSSPLYILGESYGGFRAAMMMRDLGDLKVAGLVLISPLLNASASDDDPGNDQPYVYALPTMAAAAWYHRRIARNGQTAAQFYERAARFAQTEYLVGLQQGTRLPQAERARLAAKMSQFIGLSPQTILRADLRVDREAFVRELLPDRHRRIGLLDTRAVGNADLLAKQRPPFNDPAMSPLGSAPAIGTYLHDELGVSTTRPYVSLALDVNAAWQWQTPASPDPFFVNPTPSVGTAMARQPALRLLLAGGYYDLSVPFLAARSALDHGGVPPQRTVVYAAASGHSVYGDPATLAAFSARLRTFLAAGK